MASKSNGNFTEVVDYDTHTATKRTREENLLIEELERQYETQKKNFGSNRIHCVMPISQRHGVSTSN